MLGNYSWHQRCIEQISGKWTEMEAPWSQALRRPSPFNALKCSWLVSWYGDAAGVVGIDSPQSPRHQLLLSPDREDSWITPSQHRGAGLSAASGRQQQVDAENHFSCLDVSHCFLQLVSQLLHGLIFEDLLVFNKFTWNVISALCRALEVMLILHRKTWRCTIQV